MESIFSRRKSLSISSQFSEQLVPCSFSSLISMVLVLFLFEILRDAMDDQDLLDVPDGISLPGGFSPRGGNSFPVILKGYF